VSLTKEQLAMLTSNAMRLPILAIPGDRIDYVQAHRKQLLDQLNADGVLAMPQSQETPATITTYADTADALKV